MLILTASLTTSGHPDHGPFYIIQGLVNAVPRFAWQAGTGVQTRVYTNMLALLCTLAQKKFPYHVVGTSPFCTLLQYCPSVCRLVCVANFALRVYVCVCA
jgi:hypothetical protein